MAPKYPSQSSQIRGVPVEQSRPIQAKQAIRGFQDGKSFTQVSKETGIARSTLQRLKRDHKELIASKQEQAVEKMMNVREMALSRLEDEIHEFPLASLPVTIGILSDKVRDLTGGAVSAVAHISVKLPEDVTEKTVIDHLPTANLCKQDDNQDETPANTDMDNGSKNQGAAEDTADQVDDQGAGGIDADLGGDHGTHSTGGRFLCKGKGGAT